MRFEETKEGGHNTEGTVRRSYTVYKNTLFLYFCFNVFWNNVFTDSMPEHFFNSFSDILTPPATHQWIEEWIQKSHSFAPTVVVVRGYVSIHDLVIGRHNQNGEIEEKINPHYISNTNCELYLHSKVLIARRSPLLFPDLMAMAAHDEMNLELWNSRNKQGHKPEKQV